MITVSNSNPEPQIKLGLRPVRPPGPPVRRKAPNWDVRELRESAEDYDDTAPSMPIGGSKHNAELGLLKASRDFIKDFVPPDYLVDGVLQRRFVYSATAPTGVGKTAICLTLAAHVALGRPLGDLAVEQGRVLYFAGENPDDIRMRWIALAHAMGFDPNMIPVYFLEGVRI